MLRATVQVIKAGQVVQTVRVSNGLIERFERLEDAQWKARLRAEKINSK
jgi:hypothetical protein